MLIRTPLKGTIRVLRSWRRLSITQLRLLVVKPVFLKDVLLLSAAAALLMNAAVIPQSSLSPDVIFFPSFPWGFSFIRFSTCYFRAIQLT
ncbi:hypothetical protein HPP92_014210 [Vanilla planifolia]|uniref:Uncharacterized protein n=1 Tax=Vanilla planifolia TaxID=51239 RepID=A0A835UVH4_VANPL|nr:hypothetical protein HPP92_014210 [Vanilla planifolia]